MAIVQKNNAFILNSKTSCRVTIKPLSPTSSADDYVINNIVDGQVTLTMGVREPIEPDLNEGVLLANVREGNETPTFLEFNAKFTSETGVGALETMLGQLGTDGYMPKFEITLQKFHGHDKENYIQYKGDKFVRAEGSYEITPGEQYDTLRVRFMSPTRPTKTKVVPEPVGPED
jgi:hypothetical protein